MQRSFPSWVSLPAVLILGAAEVLGGDGIIRQPSIAPQAYDSPFERALPAEDLPSGQLRWKPVDRQPFQTGPMPQAMAGQSPATTSTLPGEEQPLAGVSTPARTPQRSVSGGLAIDATPTGVSDPVATGVPTQSWAQATAYQRPVPTDSGTRQFQLASRISAQIRQPATAAKPIDNLPQLEPAPGWQAVGNRLAGHWAECEKLLRRGAHMSALDEAEQAIVYLTRIIDAARNEHQAEPAWLNAQVAMREAEMFERGPQLAEDPEFLDRLVASHSTPILKHVDLSQMSPLIAAQYYRRYALAQLLQAAQGHPWASELFVAIGQCYQARAVAEGEQGGPLWYRALVYYKAAHEIMPSNVLAANQLAYTLLQLDRPQEARQILVPAVQQRATRENLQNLVEASRRVGDVATANWAMGRLAQLGQPTTGSPLPQVTEIPAELFARLSPYEASPQVSGPRTASAPTERR
ncbi:MAG: hypothetical protein D6753_06525 [Planctomycetota bacterium]|nr:MAG: hypothetical protein D6753_06525 [Planctomycetota bacterium]